MNYARSAFACAITPKTLAWHDDLAALLGREAANERQHRKGKPDSVTLPNVSIDTATKLILLGNVESGTRLPEMPSALGMLQIRHTALEAEVIGFIVREFLSDGWKQRAGRLDYFKVMHPNG